MSARVSRSGISKAERAAAREWRFVNSGRAA